MKTKFAQRLKLEDIIVELDAVIDNRKNKGKKVGKLINIVNKLKKYYIEVYEHGMQ